MAKTRRRPARKMLSIRLDLDLLDRIDEAAAEDGVERSDLMRALLEAGLAKRTPSSPKIRKINKELVALRRQVEKLLKMTKGGRG